MKQEFPHGHVEDNVDLEAYYQELHAINTTALWTVLADTMTDFPKPRAVPYLWPYRLVRPQVIRAGQLVRPEQANRRVVVLVNPGFENGYHAIGTMQANIQMVLPGEVAPAHRHSASALRFVMEGGGAYTAVDGEPTVMHPGDLVITPNWTWHDHGNHSDGPIIWQDGLDVPLVNAVHGMFFEAFPTMQQEYTRPVDLSSREFGQSGLRP